MKRDEEPTIWQFLLGIPLLGIAWIFIIGGLTALWTAATTFAGYFHH